MCLRCFVLFSLFSFFPVLLGSVCYCSYVGIDSSSFLHTDQASLVLVQLLVLFSSLFPFPFFVFQTLPVTFCMLESILRLSSIQTRRSSLPSFAGCSIRCFALSLSLLLSVHLLSFRLCLLLLVCWNRFFVCPLLMPNADCRI